MNSRVEMPKAYSLAEVKLELPTSNGGIMTMESMKKGVLELIYNRTRYLFYNPADSISPIVPNNLRDLFNLIALLAAMEEIPDSRELTKSMLWRQTRICSSSICSQFGKNDLTLVLKTNLIVL